MDERRRAYHVISGPTGAWPASLRDQLPGRRGITAALIVAAAIMVTGAALLVAAVQRVRCGGPG